MIMMMIMMMILDLYLDTNQIAVDYLSNQTLQNHVNPPPFQNSKQYLAQANYQNLIHLQTMTMDQCLERLERRKWTLEATKKKNLLPWDPLASRNSLHLIQANLWMTQMILFLPFLKENWILENQTMKTISSQQEEQINHNTIQIKTP